MGTNAKTTHSTYAIGPSGEGELIPSPESEPEWSAVEIALQVVQGFVHNGVDPDDPHGQPSLDLPDDIEERYAMFVEAVDEAKSEIANVPGDPTALEDELHAQCELFLQDLTQDELKKLAVALGFKYPSLVGLSESSGNPLAHWLDPSYPDDAGTKQTIQAVAVNRFVALCSGETVAGKTLEEWQQLDASLAHATSPVAPPGFTVWHATAADVEAAQEGFNTAVQAIQDAKNKGSTADPDSVAALLAAENRLATAHNPALNDLDTIRSAAKHQVDQVFTTVSPQELAAAVEAAKAQEQISPPQIQVLNAQQVLKLLRASTPEDERAGLEHLAVQRAAKKATFEASAAYLDKALKSDDALPGLGSPGAPATAAAFLDHAHQAASIHQELAGWHPVAPALSHNSALQQAQSEIATWAHQQDLSDLRAFMADTGLLTSDQASVATKSFSESYLFHHAAGATTAVASLKHTLQAKYDAKASVKPVQPKTGSAVKAPVVASPRSAFGRQHAEMLSALKQAKAAHSALPKPVDASAVASWDFGAGKPAHLGGTHPKTVHTGPDGKPWLAKGEATPRGGAVVEAEAATSRLLSRAGLPVVPVFATKINGKPASVQPMLAGATEMSSNPSTWTQTDLDSVVRLHVASWALGNHDPHSGNVLRTGDGGLVPIDHGQSFKFYGQDELSMSFRPNNTTAVYHQAYDAYKNGKLAKGIHVNPAAAHSVIKRLEAVPDAEWRGMLRSAAYAGARQKQMKWVPAMRAKAAKQHGLAEKAVTTAQIAESFLDYAVERKQNLRKDFAKFFTDELKLKHADALQHAGKS